MTAFIQTADGILLNVDSVATLHIKDQSLFADQHQVGTVAKGGSLELLKINFAVRIASDHGVFGIEDGAICRQYNRPAENLLRKWSFGTAENVAWDGDA